MISFDPGRVVGLVAISGIVTKRLAGVYFQTTVTALISGQMGII
jgi:hypothetical protein